MYDDWLLLQWWVRCPKWLRIISGGLVMWAAYGCFGLTIPGWLMGAIGLLMVMHGLFAPAESGPAD